VAAFLARRRFAVSHADWDLPSAFVVVDVVVETFFFGFPLLVADGFNWGLALLELLSPSSISMKRLITPALFLFVRRTHPIVDVLSAAAVLVAVVAVAVVAVAVVAVAVVAVAVVVVAAAAVAAAFLIFCSRFLKVQ